MTYIVINDPVLWPYISSIQFSSYFVAASVVVVVYDWALTFTQEVELIWRKHWSFMTILYVCVRYIGMLYALTCLLLSLPVPMTDIGCNILHFMGVWVPVVVNAMLGVIMMTRIHAMYGQSRKMLIFLAVLLLVSTITTGVVTEFGTLGVSGGEGVLSGYHMCIFNLDADQLDLNDDKIIPTAIWEIFVFFLAVWIVIKHLRGLRQLQRGSTLGDCFTVLMQSHMLYFLAFTVMACFTLGSLSPYIRYPKTVGGVVYDGIFSIAQAFQMCLLGPRLILSVRKYHAELVDRSDEGTHMTTIAFQAGRDALTTEAV